jgi:hypothetical protein
MLRGSSRKVCKLAPPATDAKYASPVGPRGYANL